MGVLDIGSNTGHLLVVDAFRGAPPVPAHSFKESLRLAEHLDGNQAITDSGIERLVAYVKASKRESEDKGCRTLLAFATSAIRDAINSVEVIDQVSREAGIELQVLAGPDEARLTFLAARRWFGWSAGRLGVFDIGGGSLELAAGADEIPDVATSIPLGAARLTRDWLNSGKTRDELRAYIREVIADEAGQILRGGAFDQAVATSKTFRSLARITGAASSEEGPFVPRSLLRADVSGLVDQLFGLSDDEISELPGVSADRAHQLRVGAMVAEATMELFEIEVLDICPWALREGVLLQYLDQL